MSPKLTLFINRDPYLREWRHKSATLLMVITHMSENSICNILEGNKTLKDIKNICDSEQVSYIEVRKILGI